MLVLLLQPGNFSAVHPLSSWQTSRWIQIQRKTSFTLQSLPAHMVTCPPPHCPREKETLTLLVSYIYPWNGLSRICIMLFAHLSFPPQQNLLFVFIESSILPVLYVFRWQWPSNKPIYEHILIFFLIVWLTFNSIIIIINFISSFAFNRFICILLIQTIC